MIEFNKRQEADDFIKKLVKLPPEHIVALARLLNVKLSGVDAEGKITLRDADEIVEDCFTAFLQLKHKQRKIVLQAMSKGESNNGTDA